MVKNKNISGALIIIALFAGILGFAYFREQPQTEHIHYGQFITALNDGQIAEVTLTNQSYIRFRFYESETEYLTSNPRSATFKEELLLAGVTVQENTTAFNWQLGLIVMLAVGAFIYFRRKSSPATAMALSAEEVIPKYNFNYMAGNVEAKESVADIVDFLAKPEKYANYGARMPRGIILYGAPGTGKTLMAKAIAGEAGVPFYAATGSDFVQMYVGVGAARVRELFKKAREAAGTSGAIIFIDEIDALGKKRSAGPGGGNDERDQTLNALLTEMSGFAENAGIVVIAATNRLDTLDEALLRPGRFDRQIEVALPDLNARRQILKLHSKSKPMAANLEKWARDTVYFSGAMLEGLINEAAILAAKQDIEQITDAEMEKAYYISLAGHEKKDRTNIRQQERRVTAYHEAGHALASKLLSPENIVSKVSIIPSTKGAGGFCVNIPQEKMYYTKREIERQIMVYIAGRCAEEIIFGAENITTGASNDIEKASQLLKKYVGQFGMCKETGLLDLETLQDQTGLMQACKNLMESLYGETLELLRSNQGKLEAITQSLLENETLSEEDLDKIILDLHVPYSA